MADTGWLVGSSARGLVVAGGLLDWTNPTNALADDGSLAVCDAKTDNSTYRLNTHNYGATIPANAIINGIEIKIERCCEYADVGKDKYVHLMNDEVTKGNDKADTGTLYTAELVTVTYGGVADLWGESWTRDQVSASTFGIGLVCQVAAGVNRECSVDTVQVKIYYTESQSASVSDTLNLVDTILSNPGISVTDALTLSDTISIHLSAVVADILSFDDTVPLHWFVTANDTLNLSDISPRHYSVTASDTLTLNDITSIVIAYIVLVSFLSIAPSTTFTGTAPSIDFDGKIQEASMGEN